MRYRNLTPDPLLAALSDAVKRAGLYEMADAMANAIEDGTFADATEEEVRHAVYELVAKTALAAQPAPPLDVERLQAHLTHAHSLCGQCQRFAAALSEPKP